MVELELHPVAQSLLHFNKEALVPPQRGRFVEGTVCVGLPPNNLIRIVGGVLNMFPDLQILFGKPLSAQRNCVLGQIPHVAASAGPSGRASARAAATVAAASGQQGDHHGAGEQEREHSFLHHCMTIPFLRERGANTRPSSGAIFQIRVSSAGGRAEGTASRPAPSPMVRESNVTPSGFR